MLAFAAGLSDKDSPEKNQRNNQEQGSKDHQALPRPGANLFPSNDDIRHFHVNAQLF
jgi:hypothetical protein